MTDDGQGHEQGPQQGLAITGGHGFLGWHTACRLRARYGVEPIRLGRAELSDPAILDQALSEVDRVIHVAGVNRAETDDAVRAGNVDAAAQLGDAIRRAGRPVDVSFANSIQADQDNAYGQGKRAAAEVLRAASVETGGRVADVLLPNLFGEHGRPSYNSFVATFADAVARGETPEVAGDRQVPLLHAQDAAEALIAALGGGGQVRPQGEACGVSEVADRLLAMHALYAARGEIPPLLSAFDVNLFNTYRAAAWTARADLFPISPTVHADDRGELFETVRAHGGTGQAFVSTTRPGHLRGEHYHLHKVERFFVVAGTAEIQLRRLLHDEVLTFRLSGDRPSFVDMPTLWVHNIRNVGDDELVTMFWADQLLDPENPDQYPEKVAV